MPSIPPVDPASAVSTIAAGIGAIGALGIAAAGLVDGTKVFGGGLSLVGLHIVDRTLNDYDEILKASGVDWRFAVRAKWINGVSKADQKAFVLELIRLGLTATAIAAIAKNTNHKIPVDLAVLGSAATKARAGQMLSDDEVAVRGRFNDSTAARLDAAFEAADQFYRNICKLVASVVAVALSVWAGGLMAKANGLEFFTYDGIWKAILVGVLAVPLAPIAKDLASTLQAAAKALKPGQ